ncbi:hypothetical protein D3C83_01190 [compost metagenome]
MLLGIGARPARRAVAGEMGKQRPRFRRVRAKAARRDSEPGAVVAHQQSAAVGGALRRPRVSLPQPVGLNLPPFAGAGGMEQPFQRFDPQRVVALLLRGFRQQPPVFRAAGRPGIPGDPGPRLRDGGIRPDEAGSQPQPELQRTRVVQRRQPVDRLFFQPEVEQPLDEALRDGALERPVILLEAQHRAKRGFALALGKMAVDDQQPRGARFLGRRLELPQQARGISACRGALSRRHRGARAGEQALA